MPDPLTLFITIGFSGFISIICAVISSSITIDANKELKTMDYEHTCHKEFFLKRFSTYEKTESILFPIFMRYEHDGSHFSRVFGSYESLTDYFEDIQQINSWLHWFSEDSRAAFTSFSQDLTQHYASAQALSKEERVPHNISIIGKKAYNDLTLKAQLLSIEMQKDYANMKNIREFSEGIYKTRNLVLNSIKNILSRPLRLSSVDKPKPEA